MSEAFNISGESSNITAGPAPALQGLFIPGIDNPLALDGFGIVTPWGGGGTARKYGDYGLSTEISRQDTQLRDLASSLIPAEGGGLAYGLQGDRGPQGIPGPQGLPGIITLFGLNLPPSFSDNSNFVATLPHNVDQINNLGTGVDQLTYTSEYNTFYGFVWALTNIDAAVNSWNDSDINTDGSFFIIAADAGIYISVNDGDSWTKYNPDADDYVQASCAQSGGRAVVLGDSGREDGKLWFTDDYGASWTERTVGAEDPA